MVWVVLAHLCERPTCYTYQDVILITRMLLCTCMYAHTPVCMHVYTHIIYIYTYIYRYATICRNFLFLVYTCLHIPCTGHRCELPSLIFRTGCRAPYAERGSGAHGGLLARQILGAPSSYFNGVLSLVSQLNCSDVGDLRVLSWALSSC